MRQPADRPPGARGFRSHSAESRTQIAKPTVPVEGVEGPPFLWRDAFACWLTFWYSCFSFLCLVTAPFAVPLPRRRSNLKRQLPAAAQSAAQHNKMDDLLLLPYLSASSIPTLILPTAPLLEALAARQDVFPSGKRQKRPESEIRVDDRLAMPGVGGAEGQGLETAVLASLLAALQPQWVNQAWRALLSAREGSGWSPGAAGGKGKRRAAAGPPPRQAESMARGGSGGSGSGSGPVVHETSGALDLFDAGERAQLLTRLLDILSDDGADYFSPPRTPLVLSHVVLSPTLLPTRSHFVLATLSSAATSSTETPSQQVATRPLPSTSFPTFPGSPALSHEAEEHYLDSLCGTPVGQLTRDHDWALSSCCFTSTFPLCCDLLTRSHLSFPASLGPISTWCPELRAAVSSILGIPFRLNIMWGPDHLLLYNQEYTKGAGRKHPAILGLPARDAWAEIWEGLDAIAKAVMQGERRLRPRLLCIPTQFSDPNFSLLHRRDVPSGRPFSPDRANRVPRRDVPYIFVQPIPRE